MLNESKKDNGNRQRSRAKWVFVGFVLIAGFFLITEHRAHLVGWFASYWIWGLLLVCPLMHLFMHHGHQDYTPSRQSDVPAKGSRS